MTGRRFFKSYEERMREHSLPRGGDRFVPSYHVEGVTYSPVSRRVDWLTSSFNIFEDAGMASFLSQLEEQGLAIACNADLTIPWSNIYTLQASVEYSRSYPLLKLPPASLLRPCLQNRGGFSDRNFSIYIAKWIGTNGSDLRVPPFISGAVIVAGKVAGLLDREAWETLRSVAAFQALPPEQRTRESNMESWSKIRLHAKAANAPLSSFLESSVVLAPEKLTLDLRQRQVCGEKVVELVPNFPGQPPGWLVAFDRFGQVQERYEVSDGERLTHIMLTEEMKTVLGAIKNMPGRRVTGARAEAFLRNPFATLGPDANSVIDAAEFEKARDAAGIFFCTFTAQVLGDGSDLRAALVIERGGANLGLPEIVLFTDVNELANFVDTTALAIEAKVQSYSWRNYVLEIKGDTLDQLDILKGCLCKWRDQKEDTSWEIFDLSFYSERIERIGPESRCCRPIAARKVGAVGWVPSAVTLGLEFRPEGSRTPLAVSLSDENIRHFESALQLAKDRGETSFSLPGLTAPFAIAEAEALVMAFNRAKLLMATNAVTPEATPSVRPTRTGLIVKLNYQTATYREESGPLKPRDCVECVLPARLKPHIRLLDHQLAGVAWLQHLWGSSPDGCRGALLADEMGLGKTLQLLTFIALRFQLEPSLDPVLIVAPVSLLENWKEEIQRFFLDDTFPLLTLYGPALSERRLPRTEIRENLLRAGIVRLLVPGWIGDAKVVLTTYETLRDLEFPFARMKWSIMVCDEAQKIKTPTAMVTWAVKKQNARFKIACTGTPVENSLTDLWSIFDFIQPGLLSSLVDFTKRYRRPMEAETDEDRARIEQLRLLIAPQTLRRTKVEVAVNFPPKTNDLGCRSLLMSSRQRDCYRLAIDGSRGQVSSSGLGAPFDNLTRILYLRTVCSNPAPAKDSSRVERCLEQLELDSPKIRWLLATLLRIRAMGDKVIVFCEFKELQRIIQSAIAERMRVAADIVNGDTPTGTGSASSRTSKIQAFQARPGFAVIILSPFASGVGLNIQSANHVIHFTRPWNPAREDQATDRAYRIGQTKEVFVYCPLVIAPDLVTFDQRLDQLLEAKRKLSQDMLNGYDGILPSDLLGVETALHP